MQLWGCSSSHVEVQVTDFGVTYGVQDGKPVFLPKKLLPRVVAREISVQKTVLLFECVGVWSPLGVKFSYKRPLSNTGVPPLSPRDILG